MKLTAKFEATANLRGGHSVCDGGHLAAGLRVVVASLCNLDYINVSTI